MLTRKNNPAHRISRLPILGAGVLAATVLVLGFTSTPSAGYDTYTAGCNDCHGDFDGPVSPLGTVFPGNDKHRMHRASASMNTDCNLCHTEIGDDPFIGASAGTDINPGVGCTGCHGRDYGGAIGSSGVGLRAHHVQAGIDGCVTCHPDDPTPLPENILPIYYGTADTRVDDPCNTAPDFLENWSIGDTSGLDNDGDGLYDQDDPDCSPPPECPADIDRDQMVGFTDLLQVLATWGACPAGEPCPADIDGTGDVGFTDLLAVLSSWGPCEP